MTEPMYVPVLPTRPRAWDAYGLLDSRLRRRVAPLWTIVPRTGTERTRGERAVPEPDDEGTLTERWLTPLVDRLIKVMDGAPGWVDAAHAESHVRGSAAALWRLATRSALRLVTGPERDHTLQRHTADLAFLSGRGLGLRLLVDEQPDERCSIELLAMVARLCLVPSRTDLILDMGAATEGDETAKRAITALDLLGTLLPWRTVVLASGAFPRFHDQPGGPFEYSVRRYDRRLHQTVRMARPAFPRALVYGDYSSEHVAAANIPPGNGRYGPPWGLLRYTTPDRFLIARVPTRGSGHVDRVRAMARWIQESEDFRGADCSEGERWLHECAAGEGAKGSGTPETWIKMGHVQHMNFVVSRLMGAVE
ncbi:beta family protein [Streptomyces coerulescens]|uniref:Beta protein n=1 Tax=Streptomyces coerulescens TaxID=29304 RepID=A0ABW0CFX0_STRCD